MATHSLAGYFSHAGFVVQCILFILFMTSVFSWTAIVKRWCFFKALKRRLQGFEQKFWSGVSLQQLFQDHKTRHPKGFEAIFQAGFTTHQKCLAQSPEKERLAAIERSVQIAQTKQSAKLEGSLSFLAMVASTSPYVGLLGTVWGIMTAFQALGQATQVTLAMIAPGISEALVATAVGLCVAIPAAIAHAGFARMADDMTERYHIFSEELYHLFASDAHHRKG